MEKLNLIASIDFGAMLSEGMEINQTQTGRSILEKYLTTTMNNAVTCKLVNAFIKEARLCTYDNGVRIALDKIMETIDKNQYSWALATVCENINANTSRYNYINLGASKQVESLLEGRDEEEVVKYIKAGALKNVMHNESIRNVVKNIYKEQPIIIETQNFKVEHPISFVEGKGDRVYFMMENRVFSLDKDSSVKEHNNPSDTSSDFKFVNEMLKRMKFEDDTFSYTIEGRVTPIEYQVSEANVITKITNNDEVEMTVEEMRENNKLLLNTINPAHKHRIANTLECICKVAENFDNIVLLEEVSMIQSRGHMFSIVEGSDTVTLSLHKSNAHMPFTKTYTSIIEALRDVKNTLNVDLTAVFESRIDKELSNNTIREQKVIKENLENSNKQTRRTRIEALIESYKNDPAALAVLASLASELD